MEAHNNNIEDFLSIHKTRFVVPVYQRNYEWQDDNCKRLFYDIIKVIETGKEHFLGTICFKEFESREKSIIDGQQRLTSISLLLKAVFDISTNELIKKDIKENYIYNTGYGIDNDYQKIKLHLNKRDDTVYKTMLDNSYETIHEKLTSIQKESRVFQNYILFLSLISDYINNCHGSIESILDALGKMTIIELEIKEENPQEIFESFNSTRMDLTTADLLRNYLLMQFSNMEQEYLYEKYWIEIEDNVGVKNMEQFFTDYLVYKRKSDAIVVNGTKQHINLKTLYTAFKDYYIDNGGISDFKRTEEIFSDIKYVSKIYKKICFANNFDYIKAGIVEKQIYYLIEINDASKSRPLLLYLLSLYNHELITEDVLLECINAVSSLIFRSKVCNGTGINYQFAGNVLQRLSDISDYSHFSEKFWKTITFGKGGYRFPSDEEFYEALTSKDIYVILRSKGTKYLLYMLEETISNSDVLPPFTDDNISVEHIMPQTITEDWKDILSKEDINNYHEIIHKLGNLALTTDNSEMSNSRFQKKKEYYGNSKFRHTEELTGYQTWTSEEIERRSRELADLAIKIWILPEEYQKQNIIRDTLNSLCTNPKIYAFTKPNVIYIGDSEYRLNSWSSFLPIICKVLAEEDVRAFLLIANPDTDKHFALEDENHIYSDNIAYKHIVNNVYVYTNGSVHETLTAVERIVNAFDFIYGSMFYNNILFSVK